MQRKNFRMPLKAVVLGMLAGALLLAGALYASGALTGPAPDLRVESKAPDQNLVLSHGYGQIYRIVSGLKHLDKILYVKIESDKFEAEVKAVADYSDSLADELEQLDDNYPSLGIKDTGLPEIELKKRRAVVLDRLEDMAPIVGKTGKEYEVTMLITMLGPINSMRFLAQALEEEEKDRHRQEFAAKMKDRFDGLYNRILALLERDYFCLGPRT